MNSNARRRVGNLLIVLATAAAGMLFVASPASADPTVHTLGGSTPEFWAPYQSGSVRAVDINPNTNITISCYLTGDTVAGPYGAENVWDMVSGGPGYITTGSFVPDALVYTGSNSPVVPRCATALGTTIGGNDVSLYSSPRIDNAPLATIHSGLKLEIACYAEGMRVTGPYGPETIWDRVTVASNLFGAAMWVADALVYTGSNSAVVPHC